MQRLYRTAFSIPCRAFSSTRSVATAWSPGPSPPRLPKEEQEIFDQLQKQSTGAFSTPRPQINQSPQSSDASQSAKDDLSSEIELRAKVKDGEELHPNVRRGAPPEFQGDVNPKTGEAGGPKNEPLRWGYGGDWSYNGRATDF